MTRRAYAAYLLKLVSAELCPHRSSLLNLLPSIAMLGCVSRPIMRHSAMKRAHTLRMAVPLSLRKSAIVL